MLQVQIETLIKTQVSNISSQIQSIPLQESFEGFVLNYALTSSPTIASNYISFPSLGVVTSATNPVAPPFSNPTKLPLDETSNAEIQIFMSQYVLDTASFAAYKSGFLVGNLTNGEIPPFIPIHLNTTFFKDQIPSLYQKYPNSLMVVSYTATNYPQIQFSSTKGLVVIANLNTAFYVVNGGNTTPVFTLSAVFTLTTQLSIKSQKVVGAVQEMDFSFSLVSSNIGNFNVGPFTTLINTDFKTSVIPIIDQVLGAGISLPLIDNITLVNTQLQITDGFFYILSDIQPPNRK
eukprot:TRINITY_DN2336_c0_g1_i1.p1 TRINITY_DN2336_c0_g1~~TRINITY_DN2336_c0_g1_i1.p1  ORF type:complete len:291 (-),score=69.81 TRINITY_DN2336_c0_g1_i1:96-968(-)